MTVFPDTPMFRGPNRPQRIEADIFELEYEGTIPDAIRGAFYRCGPDPLFPPRAGTDIGINGDGFVSQFLFDNGHVDFRLRFVRTDKFLAERKARGALFGSYRNPFTDDPSVAGVDRTTANTAIAWYDGRLLALKEDGLPHELDPFTLETLGKFDFGGALRTPMVTAHPKVDPVSGDWLFYGFECGGLATLDASFCVGAADGTLTHEEWFKLPYAAMIHDFAVTENYAIFPIMPTTSDIDRMRAGGDHWAWDPSLPTWIGVLPRGGTAADIRYFRGPARWSFHTMNAYEEGRLIHLDTTAAPTNAFFPNIDGSRPKPSEGDFHLTRWTCDLAGNEDVFTETRLYDLPSDFYDIDPTKVGRPYRYGFMAVKATDKPANRIGQPHPFNALGKIDVTTGQTDLWYAGPESAVQEPVFVRRSDDAAEGDGYLLAVVNRLAERTSELVILDTARMIDGPVARIYVPLHLKMAFHGLFISADDLAQGRHPQTQEFAA